MKKDMAAMQIILDTLTELPDSVQQL